MKQPGVRTNGQSVPVDSVRNVYAAAVGEIIETKRVPLEARDIIPQITNLDGIDLTSRIVSWTEYNYTGKSVVTDLKPKTLPTIQADAVPKTAQLKWISIGIETTEDEMDDIANGKVYPINRTEQAFRIAAEGENSFLLDGFSKLGVKGLEGLVSGDGIHTVAAGKSWSAMTGEEIVDSVRKMKAALVADKRFTARTLCIPMALDLLLDKTYTGTGITPTGVSTREILMSRGYFENYKAVLGITLPLGLDDTPSNMGFVQAAALSIGKEYYEGRTMITPIEEKVSPFILFQPKAVVKLTGAA